MFFQKVEPLSTLCNKCLQPSRTWFVARQVWTRVVKQATTVFNSFSGMLQNKLHAFVGRFTTELSPECMTLYSMIKRVPWTFTLRTQLTRLFEAPPSTGHCNCFIPATCSVKTFLLCYPIISTFHTFRWSHGTKSIRKICTDFNIRIPFINQWWFLTK